MPSISGIPGPYRIHFYSTDCNEPAHVHVERDRKTAKFWLRPSIRAEYNDGFPGHELRRVDALLDKYREHILQKWNEHCRKAG